MKKRTDYWGNWNLPEDVDGAIPKLAARLYP